MTLAQKIETKGIRIDFAAKMLDIRPEYLSRIINGKQPCSGKLMIRINAYLDHLNTDSLPDTETQTLERLKHAASWAEFQNAVLDTLKTSGNDAALEIVNEFIKWHNSSKEEK